MSYVKMMVIGATNVTVSVPITQQDRDNYTESRSNRTLPRYVFDGSRKRFGADGATEVKFGLLTPMAPSQTL